MVQNITNFIFQDNVTSTGNGEVYGVNIAEGMTLSVIATTGTTFTAEVEARVDNTSVTWFGLKGINRSDFSAVEQITANGIFEYDVVGLWQVRVTISAISGGSVKILGRFTG